MKKDIVEFVAKYPVEHQRPGGLAQKIELLGWKCEIINMDFITGLSRSHRQHDSISVIVYRMAMSTNYLSINTTYYAKDFSMLYIQEVVRIHGVPISIISHRSAQFTAAF